MRSNILTLSLIAGLTLAGAAFADTTPTATPAPATTATAAAPAVTPVAAKTVSGTIKKIDTQKDLVVLSDGWRYHLPKGFALTGFKVGEKVSISYVMKGKHHDATAMTAA